MPALSRPLALLLASGLLGAAAVPAAAQASAPPPPAPYSLPWLLRPAAAATVVRVDQTLAFFEDPQAGRSGSTYVTGLTASYRLNARWAPVLRALWVKNDAAAGPSGSGLANPVVGVNYVRPLGGPWRLAAFGASSIPIGSGGGDSPDAGAAAAMAAGIPARSGMDNTLFAVNYWGVVGGLGVARVTRALTVQAEATVFQLTRVRGPNTQDASRTNFTAGLHVGRFLSPRVSLGAELRMQRWLSDAQPARASPAARSQLTFAVGPRFHFKAGKRTLRPGISYSRAFDDPMAERGYDIVQVDLPVAF
jgi:hypothetical protein